MSKKISQFSVKDQLEHDSPPRRGQAARPAKASLGSRKKPEPGQKNGETSSSPENGSLNGDGKRGGKSRRRRKRSSNAGSCPEGKADEAKNEGKPDEQSRRAPDRRAALMGLQSECGSVWFERSVYEQAEDAYHRRLANQCPKQASQTNPSGKRSDAPSTAAPSSSRPACHHGDQVACHHVVQMAWVNKTTFDLAESCFVGESVQQSVPKSLNLQRPSHPSTSSGTPDEGYQSLAPTPATPVQQAAVAPTAQRSMNGLPRVPAELLREVWLDKPRYDRAEAAFYQNLYGNNSFKRPSCPSTSRSGEHPQSLVEEEEEEEKEEEEPAVEEKRVVPQIKAEIFHALHPIQEEEEPAEAPEVEEESGVRFFLHPSSEPVWLDKWRYDAAESRFHGGRAASTNRRPGAETSSVPSAAQQRDKYDQTGRMEPLQMFQFISIDLLFFFVYHHTFALF